MAESFGIPQLVDYLKQMGLHIANVDRKQEVIELAFHGNSGQWRMIVGFQQSDEIRKLMLIVPHISHIAAKKRLECLEALMAVNYRIAMGKFGMDLDDGEVRLEESIPIANGSISLQQFQLVFGALMQTVAMYHSLISRIIYGNLAVREALQLCEKDFFQQAEKAPQVSNPVELRQPEVRPDDSQPESPAQLNAIDVLAEVTRILEEHRKRE